MYSEMEKFAKFVKDKRNALGLTATALAEIAFNDKKRNTYISDIENGRKLGVTIESMGVILKALNSEIKYNEL